MAELDFCLEEEKGEKGVESPKHCVETQPGRLFQTDHRRDGELCAMIEAKHKDLALKIDHQCKLLELILLNGGIKAKSKDTLPSGTSSRILGSRRPSASPATSRGLGMPRELRESKERQELPADLSKEPPKEEPPAQPAAPESKAEHSSRRSSAKSERALAIEARAKKKRPSFTPQLFKTFSQTDLTKKKKAHAASMRRSASMDTGNTAIVEEKPPNWAKRLVTRSAFDLAFTLVVVTNSIFIGVELQLSVSEPNATHTGVQIVQYVYTALFTIELWIRICADGCGLFWGDDWTWGWLDLFIVVFSLWEVGVDVLYALVWTESTGGSWSGFSNLKAFRIIRITRLVKAVRLARIFRFVMAFRLLISSILHTLKSLFWALMLLVLIIYVFAVLFTQAVNDHLTDPDVKYDVLFEKASEEYFAGLPVTMLSLFMSISGGVSWENVIAPLKEVSLVWVVVYLFYISFTYFAVLNVVTAVFCQSAIDGAQNDHASKVHAILANKEQHLTKISTLFQKFGAEGGVITFEQFQKNLKAAEVREYFQTLGLDVWDAWSFFKLLDEDGGGEVEIEEFLMGCLRLRGQATAMDVGKIINDQTWQIKNQGKFQAYVEVELKQLKEHLSILTGVNISSDEHIGLIFGDRDQGVGKTRSIDCVPAPEEEYEERSEHDEISEHVKKMSYQFDRRISP